MAASPIPAAGIRSRLRQERSGERLHAQAPLAQQHLEHRVLQDPQLAGPEFHGHMAVAQVISGLQQGQGIGAAHQQQRFSRRLHDHHGDLGSVAEGLPWQQGAATGKLQQQVPAAGAAAVAPQAAALVGAERQPQGLDSRGRLVVPPFQQDRRTGLGAHGRICSKGNQGMIRHHRQTAGSERWQSIRESTDPASTITRMTPAPLASWRGSSQMLFHRGSTPGGATIHQGGTTAPLKFQKAFAAADGRCELPLLHTAGGLVGGDELSIQVALEAGSRALITSVAAQKIYGSIGRSRLTPQGRWARQELACSLAEGADLEWLPQELVVFAGGLFEQVVRVELAAGASWLGAEVVRLGRSADGEQLGSGRWRSLLEIRREGRWSVADRLELGGESLEGDHGLDGLPVFGSLVWAAPMPLSERLIEHCRADRAGLAGEMACGRLEQGLVARYRGPSSQAARFWFTRIWARIRAERGLAAPQLPRVWPFQEAPLIAASGATLPSL